MDECRQSDRGQPWVTEDGYGLISNGFYGSITIKLTIKIVIRQILVIVTLHSLSQSDV